MANTDSGASDQYFQEEDKDCVSKVQYFNKTQVTMPNNVTLKATKHRGVKLSTSLSKEVQLAVILSGLKSS